MNISELWIAHSLSQFPKGYGGRDVNGICVTSVDTYASGCISSYMRHKKKSIDIERYQILHQCKKEIELFLPYLEGEAFQYFNRVYEMCTLIIDEAKIA
jgi:hypothetical protein